MYSRENLEFIVRAFGVATIPALLGTLVLVFIKGEWDDVRRVAVIVAATAPLVIIWSIFIPNSARHNLVSATLSVMILTYPIKLGFRKSCLALLGLVIIINYFAFAPSQYNVNTNPSGNLLSSSKLLMRLNVEANRRIGRHLASMPYARMAAYKNTSMTPYWVFELLCKPGVTKPKYKQTGFFYLENGVAKEFLTTPDNAPPETLEKLKEQGYYVITNPNVYLNLIWK
jgi:hypothetical protein